MKKILSVVVLISIVTLVCCNDDAPVKKEKVTFSLTTENILNSLGNVQYPLNAATVKAVYVTVSNENDKVVLNNKKLTLTLQDGNYTTESIKLKAGEYRITKFKVVDDSENVTFESPEEGSSESELVNDAVPINFMVSNGEQDIKPQVLSTIESIGFKLGVYTFNAVSENFEISSADIEVTSEEEVVADRTLSATTTQVDVEKLNAYTVTISKSGYIPVVRSFTLSELQAYTSQALYVRLYAESTASNLAVYYSFSGNANDESGHVSAGVNEGAVLVSDQYGNFNSAYRFDGVNDYINLGDILDEMNVPFTFSVWIKRELHPTSVYNPVFTSQEGSTPLYNGFDVGANTGSHHGISLGDGLGENNSAYRKSKTADAPTDKTNVWNHLSLVVTSRDDIKIYIDGVLTEGIYSGGSTSPMATDFPADVAAIGKWTSNGLTHYYTGSVDELRIWKQSLTAQQIKASM